jgi:hypothetical protein
MRMSVWPIINRLSLGMTLILFAAAVLLISDRGQLQNGAGRTAAKRNWKSISWITWGTTVSPKALPHADIGSSFGARATVSTVMSSS